MSLKGILSDMNISSLSSYRVNNCLTKWFWGQLSWVQKILWHTRYICIYTCIYIYIYIYIYYIYTYQLIFIYIIVHKGVPNHFFKAPTPRLSLPLRFFLRSLFPLPSFLFRSLLRYFRQFLAPSSNPFLP